MEVQGNYNGYLNGCIKVLKFNATFQLKSELNLRVNDVIYKKIKDNNICSTNVAIIDGGIPTNSIVKKDLDSYISNYGFI